MSSSWSEWVWHSQYGRYYRTQLSADGKYEYEWDQRTGAAAPQSQGNSRQTNRLDPTQRPNTTMGFHTNRGALRTSKRFNLDSHSIVEEEPQTSRNSGLGQGYTPGRNEALDSSYKIQPSGFFRRGKFIALLFTESAGSTAPEDDDNNITFVRHGERAYSQIRRFVIVQEKQGFCYGCPIYTYSNRGISKPGVNAKSHAIIYREGFLPQKLPTEGTFEKQPICVRMPNPFERLDKASRINFGIQHVIQHNVKVKDLGNVIDNHLSLLLQYWKMENDDGTSYALPSSSSYQSQGQLDDLGEQAAIYDPRLQVIAKPLKWFRKGRLFLTPWTKPAPVSKTVGAGHRLESLRAFIVLRPRPGYSLCVSAHGEVLSPDLPVIVEEDSLTEITSVRFDYNHLYKIHHAAQVLNIGRIGPSHFNFLDEYCAAVLHRHGES